MLRIPLFATALTAALSSLVVPSQALAHGLAFRSAGDRGAGAATTERTLVLHDAARQQEHLFRQVTVLGAARPVALAIAVPARPSVEVLARGPFEGLEAHVHHRAISAMEAEALLEHPPKQRPIAIAGVTTETIAVDDAAALDGWLAKSRLVRDAAADAWLAQYRGRGFHLVLVRCAPPGGKVFATPVLHLEFASPVPYLPYSEPAATPAAPPRARSGEGEAAPPGADAPAQERTSRVWVVASTPVTPVATRWREGALTWVQPIGAGEPEYVEEDARRELAAALGPLAGLLPGGTIWARSFGDAKLTRDGYGDVLFARTEPKGAAIADSEALDRLLPTLDPKLAGGAP